MEIGELILICNHCGKEVESLKSAILELHGQGKSPMEIREELKNRLQGTAKQKLMTVHVYLHTYKHKY